MNIFPRCRAAGLADLPPVTTQPPLPVRHPTATPADLARAAGDLATTQLAGDSIERHTTPPAEPIRTTELRRTIRVTFCCTHIPPLTVHQATRDELADAIAVHVRPYLGAVQPVVDRTMPHVLLRDADRTVAAATLTILPTTTITHGGNRNA